MAETYTSGAINFTGLGDGTDFNQLVDSLVNVEQRRVTRLETWKSSWAQKNTQFKDLNTQMLSLKTTLEKLDTVNEFMSKSVSSADTSIITATANSDAQQGAHVIEVGQLASSDVQITASGVSSLSTAVTTTNTNFTFSYAGETHTISNISANTSLSTFVNIINTHPESSGVIRASTIFDGSVYHLQINGLDQGADNQLVISNAGDIIFNNSDFNETQNAANSQIKVNGFPPGAADWIERPSNVVDDVIEGLTLNFKSAKPGTEIQINVTTDKEAIKENIVKFVDEVNAIRARVQAITKVDGTASVSMDQDSTDEKDIGSILTGNYGVDIISQKLKNITAEMGVGFQIYDPDTGKGDKYSSLSQIGILTDATQGSSTYGLLKIDMEELDKALDNDAQAVARLFAADYEGGSDTSELSYSSRIKGTTKPGDYEIEVVSDGTQITSATINGVEANISGWNITAMSGDATGLVIKLDDTSAGTHSGTISLKQGKSGQMIDELTELTKPFNKFTNEGGPLAVLQNNYDDIMDSIDDKIAYENRRIEKLERTMKLKFSRLDTLLGQYRLKQGQLTSAITQLGS